jgi:hypothetical protein
MGAAESTLGADLQALRRTRSANVAAENACFMQRRIAGEVEAGRGGIA